MPENEVLDPAAILAISLIDKTLGNGNDVDIPKAMQALGEAAKANLQISCNNNVIITKHVTDDNCHTPRGILIRTGVISWFILIVIIISSIVIYIPDLLKWFKLP